MSKSYVKCPLCSLTASCTCTKDKLKKRILQLQEYCDYWKNMTVGLQKQVKELKVIKHASQ